MNTREPFGPERRREHRENLSRLSEIESTLRAQTERPWWAKNLAHIVQAVVIITPLLSAMWFLAERIATIEERQAYQAEWRKEVTQELRAANETLVKIKEGLARKVDRKP